MKKNWDGQQLKDEVTAQVQITSAFGQLAAKNIGDYADTKQQEAIKNKNPEEAAKWAEGGAYRIALHTATGALISGLGGAAGALTSASAMTIIGNEIDKMDLPTDLKQGLAQIAATALGAAVGGAAGVASGLNVEANNRQLHPEDRTWAKDNAKKFARYYKDQTGQDITADQAQKMLLGDGYRMVDAAANKGPGVAGTRDDALAVSFISQNAGNLFKASAAEYNNPGKLGGPLTLEQAALPGAVGNPALGLGAAAALATGGLAGVAGPQLVAAGVGAVQFGADAWAAYKAASAAYSMGTALGTGAAIGGGGYTVGAGASAIKDYLATGKNLGVGFDQNFSYPGLGAAMTVGGLGGMYGTAMFGWAGVPNAIGNVATVPGFVIRSNSFFLGQFVGKAAQGAVNSSTNP